MLPGILASLAAAALSASSPPLQPPPAEPATSRRIVAAARREGKVVVYSATDRSVAEPLLRDFAELYPGIVVEYHDLITGPMFDLYVDEVARGAVAVDVLWSPAMDLQMKLANDGLALAYESPEAEKLPSWAVWRNEAYATTLEPFVFVHAAGRAGEIPQSHAELVKLLESHPERIRGRVATYDPEKSAIGYLLLTQDSRIDPGFPDAIRAYGRSALELDGTTSAMINGVRSGELLLAFNVNGSYALAAQRSAPDLQIVYPSDYVLAASRIAIIARQAPHPNAAKTFLDYLLSSRGQEVLANRCSLFSIRTDVAGETTAGALARSLGARLKPIHVGPSLLVFLDSSKRKDFLRRWRAAFARR
jgi:iron(III) transport system substrate-binding protein